MQTSDVSPPKTSSPTPLHKQITVPFLFLALLLACVSALGATLIIATRWGTLPADWAGIAAGLFMLLVILASAAVLITGHLVAAPIARRLRQIGQVVEAAASGDLTQRTGMSADDEFGALGRNFDAVVGRLTARTHQLNAKIHQHEETIAHLSAALAHLPDGVIVLDQRTRITLMNRAARALLGTEEDFWDNELGDFTAHLDSRPLPQSCTVHLNGQTLQADAAAITTLNGGRLGVVLVVQDITHTTAAASHKDRFVSRLIHELHAPLSEVLDGSAALAELLPEYPFVQAIRRNTGLMASLTGEALDIAQMLDDTFTVAREQIALETLLSSVLQTYAPHFRRAGQELRANVLSPSLQILGAPEPLRLALEHLLDNALYHTPRGGQVTLTMGALIVGYAVIDIADTGPGIHAKELPHIFEPYYQGTPAREGMGLGLFIARAIVEAHGGRLTATSTPGEGSTFSLILPLAQR